MSDLEAYLRELAELQGPGVPETSGYVPLSNLLNAVGDSLKPKVRCIINMQNVGAGIPDGGLFTAGLLKKHPDAEPLSGLLPDRGAIEVKAVSADAGLTAESTQVSKYWQQDGHVLVTNYRDFLMVGRDNRGKPVVLETYRLAANEKAFWQAAHAPRATADLHDALFTEYLTRVLLHAAMIGAPKDVAWFLASYARDARIRIEQKKTLPALTAVRKSLEGNAGKGGICMPGKGKVAERGGALDIYLNESACWRNVPVPVWEYTLGGYQVVKKWLSYREAKLLGRSLKLDKVGELTNMARRMAAILALQPALDANYRAVKGATE